MSQSSHQLFLIMNILTYSLSSRQMKAKLSEMLSMMRRAGPLSSGST